MAVLLAQLAKKVLALLIVGTIHRQLVALVTVGVTGMARQPMILSHHRSPSCLCDGMDRQPKSSGQCYRMLGFVVVSPLFTFRAAHQESPGRYPGELHPDRVGPERADRLDSG